MLPSTGQHLKAPIFSTSYYKAGIDLRRFEYYEHRNENSGYAGRLYSNHDTDDKGTYKLCTPASIANPRYTKYIGLCGM